MNLEPLRELIERWRKESDDFERDGDEGTASAYYNCAEQLSAILADLGQEAGAVACRGYAKLGIGAYLIEHSAESEPAALMLCIASDEEKAGRTVGDIKTFEGERQPIPAEKMTVRIDFANVAGLDALEQQLRILREVHFPASPAHTSDARDAARLDWLDAKCTNVADEYGIASQLYFGTYATGKLRESIDAAMRQDGGK